MKHIFGPCSFKDIARAEENCYMLTNGLGGFSSLTMAGSNARNDHAFLMAALTAPNKRYHLITNFIEKLIIDGREYILSASRRVNDTENLYGFKYLLGLSYEYMPEWIYMAEGVTLKKIIVMPHGKNAAGVLYKIEGAGKREVKLVITPLFQFVKKGFRLNENQVFERKDKKIISEGISLFETTNGVLKEHNKISHIRDLYYNQDARDGRDAVGISAYFYDLEFDFREINCAYAAYELIDDKASKSYFASDIYKLENNSYQKFVKEYYKFEDEACQGFVKEYYKFEDKACQGFVKDYYNIEDEIYKRVVKDYKESCMLGGLKDNKDKQNIVLDWALETIIRAKWLIWLSNEADKNSILDNKVKSEGINDFIEELAVAADKFVTYRESTDGMSILAGFPFFCDWGRDTMIALTGCVIKTGRFETAKSIMRTFIKYINKGLMPNLFPEGEDAPLYNTVDAALLFFEAANIYYNTTKDKDFVLEVYPYMEDIIYYYSIGTDYSIKLDEDGLIMAGSKDNQVTWMDAKYKDMVMTKRHGKPVEINAYWYNALCIAKRFQEISKADNKLTNRYDAKELDTMAEKTKKSFLDKFVNKNLGGLKDVLSGNYEEEQIRCNQIWTLSLSYVMPDKKLAVSIIEVVEKYLLTAYGLRSLAPTDPQYKPYYKGHQSIRDMAYHQGTVWAYPLGAYIIAKKRFCNGIDIKFVEMLKTTLNEGCLGNIAEIFDAEYSSMSQGCFAQAWSVGEILKACKWNDDL